MLASAVCLLSQETLFGLLKDYNALVREDGTIPPKATIMFNQTFEAGSEEDPKCKRCGKYIAEHQSADVGRKRPRGRPLELPPLVDESSNSSLLQFVASDEPWIVYSGQKNLVVRKQEYPPIWDLVHAMLRDHSQNAHHLLVVGHPGIGKSCMLNYLLWRWASSDLAGTIIVVGYTMDVLSVFYNKQRFDFDHQGIQNAAELVGDLKKTGQIPPSKVLLLHDLKTEQLPFNNELYSALLKHFPLTCVLASSPNGRNYHVYMQLATVVSDNQHSTFGSNTTRCLGPWSKQEMQEYCTELSPLLYRDMKKSVDDAFDLAGGVPRSWEINAQSVKDKIDAAVPFFTGLDTTEIHKPTDNQKSALVAMIPDANRQRFGSADFVSAYVFHRVWENILSCSTARARDFYLTVKKSGATRRGPPR